MFTLAKSTEPFADEFYTLDLEAAVTDAGLADPLSTSINPRHSVLCARKPAA